MEYRGITCDNNDKIFEYLNPDANVILSDLNNSDRFNILFWLKSYYLELRKYLDISPKATIGLEIEFENTCRRIVQEKLSGTFSTGSWDVVKDESLFKGAEINSPQLVNSSESWIDLCTVCDIVEPLGEVLECSSVHVHGGVQLLGNNPKYWANFSKLWLAYENIIFRFLFGEYLAPRKAILQQARPIAVDLYNNLDRINDRATSVNATNMFKVLDAGASYQERRKRALNFTNVSGLAPYELDLIGYKHTIECRVGNGSLNPIVIQNYVNLFLHLFMYAMSDRFDEEIIDRRIKQIASSGIMGNIHMYSRIYYEQAIEFADLVFDNNLDKIYFLRQYIKDGSVSNIPMTKSKEFTRRRIKK